MIPTSASASPVSRPAPPGGVRRRLTIGPRSTLGKFLHKQTRRRNVLKWTRELGLVDHEVRELIQEVILLMVEKTAEGNTIQPEAWQSWFQQAMARRAKRLIRAKAIRKRYEPRLAAELDSPDSPFPSPDEELLRDEIHKAKEWLLDAVHESRRDVAVMYVRDGCTLASIAEETGTPPGTVFCQWERAKQDMRRAIERERATQGNRRFLVILAALIELWNWLVGLRRRVAGAVASLNARELDLPASGVRVGRLTNVARERRLPIGACLACVVLVVMHQSHRPLEPLLGESSALASTVAASDHAPVTTRDFQSRNVDLYMFAPYLTTNAERERDWDVRPAPRAAPSAALTHAQRRLARGLFAKANKAIGDGHPDVAREAMKAYDLLFPQDPYYKHRADIAASLRVP